MLTLVLEEYSRYTCKYFWKPNIYKHFAIKFGLNTVGLREHYYEASQEH